MNKIKLYNIIFPTFMLIAIVPIFWIISITGNFIIDSLVLILASYFIFKAFDFSFYKKTILKVWLLGFLADIVGVIYLSTVALCTNASYYEGINLWKQILSGIYLATNHSHFDSIWGVLFILSGILLSTVMIFFFNYAISFKGIDNITKKNRIYLSLTYAIITAPYTFLIPSDVLYNLSV